MKETGAYLIRTVRASPPPASMTSDLGEWPAPLQASEDHTLRQTFLRGCLLPRHQLEGAVPSELSTVKPSPLFLFRVLPNLPPPVKCGASPEALKRFVFLVLAVVPACTLRGSERATRPACHSHWNARCFFHTHKPGLPVCS